MKLLVEWPKMDVANCSQSRIDRPEESRPPRYMYSLRLAMMAAQEKQPKAMAVPTNPVTRMLVTQINRNVNCRRTLNSNELRLRSWKHQISSTTKNKQININLSPHHKIVAL
jgi:hypothetical protein